ncbi:MAG: fibro-slime domain-containing protein [Myxococcaceae bacterium]|nr:fibro-slime domain-containing protein [Myxococcaceae bacterium]
MRTLVLASSLFVVGCQCGGSEVVITGAGDGGLRADGGQRDGGGAGAAGGGAAGGGLEGGGSAAGGSAGGAPDAGPPCDVVIATIRDFRDDHPDFESFSGSRETTGLVRDALGPDDLPVHAANGPTSQTTGPANFNQWYRDAGVNQAFQVQLPVMRNAGGDLVFDSDAFFPIDGQGFGNQGRANNFHFTTVIRSSFTYRGGERFTFRGDDDVWIFVNRRLALDLGGLHPAVMGSIDFDAQASRLGLTRGQTYRFDVFHAERHTSESNFRMQTSIDCFRPPEIQ